MVTRGAKASASGEEPEVKPPADEAEANKRKVMREMAAKGGRTSKRGKAKPKTENNEELEDNDGVST